MVEGKRRVFVTGAAGFIGFHVAKALELAGHDVLGFDNFNSYYDPLLKEARVKEFKKVRVIRADLQDVKALKDAITTFNPTEIIHLAAQAGVRYSLENPQSYIDANITGFLNILEVVKEIPTIRVVYASSSSVYGLKSETPFSTDDRTDAQASLYGVTKKCNELMASTYHHLYGLNTIGLRYFTVYGPWGRPDMAYFSFTKAILENMPINLFNDGKMLRDFTYIDDIVSGTLSTLNCSGCKVYNLGNNEPVELISFVETLEEVIGKKAIKKMLPMQKGDVFQTYANISTSSKDLNFYPKTRLKEGLQSFVLWYRKFYE